MSISIFYLNVQPSSTKRENFIYLITVLGKCGTGRFISADGLCRCSYIELTLAFESLSLKYDCNCCPSIFLEAQKQHRNQMHLQGDTVSFSHALGDCLLIYRLHTLCRKYSLYESVRKFMRTCFFIAAKQIVYGNCEDLANKQDGKSGLWFALQDHMSL